MNKTLLIAGLALTLSGRGYHLFFRPEWTEAIIFVKLFPVWLFSWMFIVLWVFGFGSHDARKRSAQSSQDGPHAAVVGNYGRRR
jgi:hypothetical protein